MFKRVKKTLEICCQREPSDTTSIILSHDLVCPKSKCCIAGEIIMLVVMV